MKTLKVETEDSTETYELSDEAVLSMLPNGQLWCEDNKKTIITYAPGKFISAALETTAKV